MEASSLSFSSLTLIRALVICSVKARLSVLVWGSLDILCRKPITSGKVQLSKSNSLPSIKEVVMSFKLTCLKASMFIEVSSSMFEVVASPDRSSGTRGVMGANSLNILNYLDSGYCVVGRKALNSLFFLLLLAHLSLSFPSILIFSLIWTWMAFIGVVCRSSGGEVLIFSISTSWAMLSTFEERISSLSKFSSTLLLKALWVVVKSLSKVSSSKVEFLVVG